jgi:hypothetical protein
VPVLLCGVEYLGEDLDCPVDRAVRKWPLDRLLLPLSHLRGSVSVDPLRCDLREPKRREAGEQVSTQRPLQVLEGALLEPFELLLLEPLRCEEVKGRLLERIAPPINTLRQTGSCPVTGELELLRRRLERRPDPPLHRCAHAA